MPFGWEGQKVRLAPLDRERHLENALLWLNDPQTTEWMLTGDWPLTRLAEEEYFERMMRQDDTDLAFAIETLDGVHIGFSGINQIEWRHGVGTTGTVIGPADFRGKGYGSDSIVVRTRYAFEVLGLRQLLSSVFADNGASYRALLKAGYREIGRYPRRYWKRGAYRDIIRLVIERDAWPAGGAAR